MGVGVARSASEGKRGGDTEWPRSILPSDETFTLADGSDVERDVGDVQFEIGGRKDATPVIFGRRGDAAVLGAITRETLGLELNPLKRRIRPVVLTLG